VNPLHRVFEKEINMKRLYRSATNKKIAGVCGGIGEMLNVDPTIIRLLFIVGCFMTGFFPLIFGYIVAMFLVPIGPSREIQQ